MKKIFPSKSAAFTLAEVLIALAIIGVIAAITIPSIVANHKKRTLETQFAKTYRNLMQMINLAQAEHGSFDTWEWPTAKYESTDGKDEFVQKYFLPYLNVAKFCPAVTPEGCFATGDLKRLNGTTEKNFNGRTLPKAVLADGTSVQFNIIPSNTTINNARKMAIELDVNGFKPPNTVGYDVFAFNLYTNAQFAPHGAYQNKLDTETQALILKTTEEINEDCSKNGNGWDCSARIINEGFKINY